MTSVNQLKTQANGSLPYNAIDNAQLQNPLELKILFSFNSLKPQRHAWACCFKNESMDMLHCTTWMTQSMNSSLKYSVSKKYTFAKLSLNEYSNPIMNHSNEYNCAKET